ncbi:hypothetical protein E2C01_002105 [Portunus trituberculatus]|uniref:Uncharacterized protein n=1 Tax=Portunus trituberculatus TaxID=210409 RepID=A0A5B7CIH5_PORTR|nr:hypothetical protein [Portunus trituberculatus]
MHQVEVGLPIIPAHTEKPIAQQTHPSTITAHTETSHLCPCVCSWVIPEVCQAFLLYIRGTAHSPFPLSTKSASSFSPLHTIKSGSTRVGGRGIMSPHSVQETIHHSNSYPTSPPGHGGTGGPFISVRVIALHCAQAGRAVTPSHRVQPAVSVGGHGRQLSPGVGGRVISLHCIESLESVPAAHHVQLAIQHCYAKLEAAASHGAHAGPAVGPQHTPMLWEASSLTYPHQHSLTHPHTSTCTEQKTVVFILLPLHPPLLESMPPTTYMSPTVDLRGLVRGDCRADRRSGSR